jgi:hypothetical protein
MIIAQIKKNRREQIGISLGNFKGHAVCDIRCHNPTASDDWLPTPKGLTFSVGHLPEILEALKAAEKQRKETK